MKKTLVSFLFLSIICLYNAFSQDGNLKPYFDYENGFTGAGLAIFLGEEKPGIQEKLQEFLSKYIPNDAQQVSKVTKKNMWLLKQALNEWELKKDEYYLAVVAENVWASNGLLFIVKIKEKDDFEWKGYYLSEKVVEKLNNSLDE